MDPARSDPDERDSGVSEVRGRGGDPWGRGRYDETEDNPWGTYPAAEPDRGSESATDASAEPLVQSGSEPAAGTEPGAGEARSIPPAAAEDDDLAGLARPSTAAEEVAAADLQPAGRPVAATPPTPEPEPDPDPAPDLEPVAPAEMEVPSEPPTIETEPRPPVMPARPPTPVVPPTTPPPPTRPTATGGSTGGDGGGPGRPPTETSSSGGPPEPPPPSEPRGLRQQFGRTRDAALALVKAHIDLAQAELSEIVDEIKRLLVVIGVAIGLGIFIAILVSVGTTLWLGEWLFGSMAWGVLHGTELSIGVIVALVVAWLGLSGRMIFGLLLAAAAIGTLAGAVFGLQLFNQLWDQIGIALFPGLAPETRPLVVGLATMGLIVGVLLFILGLRGGIGNAISGLIVGAILGALLGAFTAITFSWQVAAALGVAITLALWPTFVGLAIQRRGIDPEELKNRFNPNVTIETTKETIEWVRERTQRGQKS